ncbi:MAG: hypothetical protein IJ785_07645 [Bacteroidales bacterium]|nr:hypothetical protein [Bacteroidales bacterium]
MQFNLTYSEVGQFILDKTGKELPLAYGGPHTLRISYKVPLMGSVGLDVNVDRINGSDIFLSYGGGAGVEFMVRTALGQFKKQQQGADILDILDGNRLMLALGRSSQLGPVFDRITLKDIHFDEHSLMVDFVPKTN